ncbi:MAG: YHS domain-containing (seleno)protein [Bacteroidota bacterium]
MKVKSILTIFCLTIASAVFSQSSIALRQAQYNLKNNIALKGYDPVAYSLLGKALKGNKDLGGVTYNGVAYYFALQSTKDIFNLNPAKYEPTYGGWCAYAMGKRGEKVSIDPEAFKVVDGKVYLFYGKSQVADWNKEEQTLKSKADQFWLTIFR